MKESLMQVMFGKYVKDHPPKESEAYELKICKTTSLPFVAVKEHQIKALLEGETDILFHKISDPPMFYGGKLRFNLPRPFDCFILVKVKGYVVLWFYKPRKQKVFIKIPIQDYIKEMETSERKSLTEERAEKIGELLYI